MLGAQRGAKRMCLFCRMVAKEIPAKVLFEDDEVLAFHDINPQAPVHVLVIPKRHVASLSDAGPGDEAVLGRVVASAKRVAELAGIQGGYRTVFNTGPNAGQTVFHVHMHVLGGRPMAWPPG
jgi:histidine triad (HIT) family protein